MCYYLVVISMKIELIKANAQNVSVANELLTMLIKTEKSYIENIKDDFVITLNYEEIYKNLKFNSSFNMYSVYEWLRKKHHS